MKWYHRIITAVMDQWFILRGHKGTAKRLDRQFNGLLMLTWPVADSTWKRWEMLGIATDLEMQRLGATHRYDCSCGGNVYISKEDGVATVYGATCAAGLWYLKHIQKTRAPEARVVS